MLILVLMVILLYAINHLQADYKANAYIAKLIGLEKISNLSKTNYDWLLLLVLTNLPKKKPNYAIQLNLPSENLTILWQ